MPRQNSTSQKVSLKGAKCSATTETELEISFDEAGPSWSRANDTTSAVATAVAKAVDEGRPPDICKAQCHDKIQTRRGSRRVFCGVFPICVLPLDCFASRRSWSLRILTQSAELHTTSAKATVNCAFVFNVRRAFFLHVRIGTRQLLQHSWCLPSRMCCNSREWDVVGDSHRHHPVVRARLKGTLRSFLTLLWTVSCGNREVGTER